MKDNGFGQQASIKPVRACLRRLYVADADGRKSQGAGFTYMRFAGNKQIIQNGKEAWLMAWICWYAQRSIAYGAKDAVPLYWTMPERPNGHGKRDASLHICVASGVRRCTAATGE